ncbi:uncharacterized protein [Engystomops pustulosus]|uniref:uncharacterized protein isoform X4 n=1 Tax=Engystomops pustulosus TaxID=76066 RepID=UPI003AFB1F5D
MATDDAIRQRLRAEGSAWLSSLLAEAQATDLAPSAPPPQDVRRSGPTDPDEGAASEEDIIGSEFSPLDPNTLVVPPPLVAPLMAGELGTGYVLAHGQRRASSVRSRASSSRSRRSSSSRRRRASRSRSGREKRRRSRGRRSASRSGSSRSSQRASSGSSGTPSPKRQHGGSRSRGSSVRSHRSSREQVSGPSAALAMAAPGRSSSAPRPASASGVSIPLPSGGCGRDSVPGFPVVNSRSQLRALVQSSLAPSTWTAHGKAWAEWSVVAGSVDFSYDARVRLDITLRYLEGLRDKGVSGLCAQRRLAGIAFFFKLHGWVDVTQCFFIKQVIKGWKKDSVRRESRRPVSYSVLLRLLAVLDTVCRDGFEVKLVSAAFVTAFFGALRISELVPPSANKPGGLLFEDVSVSSGGLRLRIRRSKTDVFGRGCWVSLRQVGGSACPVLAVSNFLAIRVGGVQFFSHADSSPLTRFQFTVLFKKALAAAGFPPGEFGTHSFRIGAATTASELGLSDAEVQRIGRWRSECFAGYIRPDLLIN